MHLRIAPALLLAIAAAGASADEIYKSTMPDGRVVYGEAPFPGATQVRKIPAPGGSSGVTVVTPQEKGRGDAATGAGGSRAVGVLPTPPRKAAPPLAAGTSTPRDSMPARGY